MPTSTFDKKIVLDEEAARILAEALNDPTPVKRPESHFKETSDEDWKAWIEKVRSE